MNKSALILFAALAVSLANLTAYAHPLPQSSEHPTCDAREACIDIVATYDLPPEGDFGTSLYEIESAVETLLTFGDDAVDALVGLLKHPHGRVRERAREILRKFYSIDAKHLPAFIDAAKTEMGYLAYSIAKVGTPEAIDFLLSEYEKYQSPFRNSYVFSALATLGDQVSYYFVDILINCSADCPPERVVSAFDLLSRMDPLPPDVAPVVISFYENADTSPLVREGAAEFLIDRRHAYGIGILIERIRATPRASHPEVYGAEFRLLMLLRELAAYGEDAKAAAPILEEFLGKDQLRDTRAAATFFAGLIGYEESIPYLMAALADGEDDWLLAYNAIESLARLNAVSSINAIRTLESTHWSLAVRNNAKRAIELLEGGESKFQEDGYRLHWNEIPMWHVVYPKDHADWCEDGQYTWPPKLEGVSWRGDTYAMQGLRSIGRFEEKILREKIRYLADRRPISGSLKTRNGWLVGTDAGEWGGALYHISKRGKQTLMINENVDAIVELGSKIYVITGLAHGSSDEGRVWEVDISRRVIAVLREIRMPGDATGYTIVENKALLIGTRKEPFAITAEGKLEPMSFQYSCE